MSIWRFVYDVETGLYYLKSRYYNPGWQRFLNTDDHFTDEAKNNLQNIYIYCKNSPVALFDDTGHEWIEIYDPRALIGMVGTYNTLRVFAKGTGLEVHHLIEKRLYAVPEIGERYESTGYMESVILDPQTHKVMTQEWRKAVPYGSDYQHMSYDSVRDLATNIYGAYDHGDWIDYLFH